MRSIVLIVHNVRSAHNVGSMLRTCEGLGINQVFLSGYTPYPAGENDKRLPHETAKAYKQIQKTALGAEKTLNWSHEPNIKNLVGKLKSGNYQLVGLEQTEKSFNLLEFKPTSNIALVVGSEIGGLDKLVLDLCDIAIQIPMAGQKESFNVSIAAAIALYQLKYITP